MIEKIGEGTYGQVYKACHRRLGHLVAMKKMRIHSDAQG
jgi:serine/threonine protein kinase